MPKKHKRSSRKSQGSRTKNDVFKDQAEDTDAEGFLPENSVCQIEHSPIMGRYLVTKKALKAGHVIISEYPIVIGPCQDSGALCLGCYKEVQIILSEFRCEKCKWPLCGPKCPGFHTEYGHSVYECEKLSQIPEDGRPTKAFDGEMYNAIVPFRCLLIRSTDVENWIRLCKMESHNELRKRIPKIWDCNQRNVVDVIRKKWGFTEFPEEEIHTVCGYLEVNSFAVGQDGVNIRGLYPTCFLISHDCVPNTTHLDDENFKMTVRASVSLEKQQMISLSYANTLQGTMKRRIHLKESKFFECSCNRCSDRTELGTYYSALKCTSCRDGYLLADNPLDHGSPWKCLANDCDFSIKAEEAVAILTRGEKDMEKLKGETVHDCEVFLKKYRNLYHPNHYLMVGAKLLLSQMYGKTPGYMIYEVPNEILERKLNICQEIMKVIDIFEPGLTRLRGMTMYELHAPLMILTMNHFKAKLISQKDFKRSLKEVVKLLKESHCILSFEPNSSQEGSLCQAAKEALNNTKGWEKLIGKI